MADQQDAEKLIYVAIVEHQCGEDPDGLALRCDCNGWAMLHRNSFGQDARAAHFEHAARAVLATLADAGLLLPTHADRARPDDWPAAVAVAAIEAIDRAASLAGPDHTEEKRRDG